MSPLEFIPWNPAIIIMLFLPISSLSLLIFMSDILADPWISLVSIPAWEPDKLITFFPNELIEIANKVDETNYPVDNKISLSHLQQKFHHIFVLLHYSIMCAPL